MSEYVVIYEQAEDGGWGAYIPDLPGVVALGATRAEVGERIKEALDAYSEDLRDRGVLPHSSSRRGHNRRVDSLSRLVEPPSSRPRHRYASRKSSTSIADVTPSIELSRCRGTVGEGCCLAVATNRTRGQQRFRKWLYAGRSMQQSGQSANREVPGLRLLWSF
jgi:predicted RNase H-like HicB family nuclease